MFRQSYGLADFATRFKNLSAAPTALPEVIGRQIGQLLIADVKAQFYAGRGPDGAPWPALKFPRPQGGDKPLLNTGVLANSYHAFPDTGGVTIASAHPGAGLQLRGGVVRPRRAKMLAIPLTKEAVRYSSPRRFPRKLFVLPPGDEGTHPSLAEQTGEQRTRRGKLKRAAGVVRHYLLVRETQHVPHPLGFTEAGLKRVDALLLDHLEQGTFGS